MFGPCTNHCMIVHSYVYVSKMTAGVYVWQWKGLWYFYPFLSFVLLYLYITQGLAYYLFLCNVIYSEIFLFLIISTSYCHNQTLSRLFSCHVITSIVHVVRLHCTERQENTDLWSFLFYCFDPNWAGVWQLTHWGLVTHTCVNILCHPDSNLVILAWTGHKLYQAQNGINFDL